MRQERLRQGSRNPTSIRFRRADFDLGTHLYGSDAKERRFSRLCGAGACYILGLSPVFSPLRVLCQYILVSLDFSGQDRFLEPIKDESEICHFTFRTAVRKTK